ncbi:hypothetical protein AAC387_Pa03g3783 [Persea americana]
MDVISFKSLTFAVQGSFPARWHLMCGLSERIPVLSLNRKANSQTIHSRFIPSAKGFPFQDFQGFAKPLRLFPAEETSGDFGSTLSDLNAAILLCMIDVNGDSILQRIPMTTLEHTRDSEETADSVMLRFQRGSIDKLAFKGPKLREIEALWIGLESGCWRLGVVSLTVICTHQSSLKSTEYGNQHKYSGQHYQFDASDIPLGDSGGVSMVELRPTLVREVDRVDFLTLFNMGVSQSASATNNKISNDESMKEYADLKLSLLLYDALLIFIGTSIAAVFIDKNAAYAFLIGGGSGFLYLLLLQKSVDGLPTPSLSVAGNKKDDLTRVFGGFKGTLSSVALALILSVIAVKYGFGSASVVLTPRELLVGVAGFLTCKIAVILAAFKPMQASKKEDK